LGLRVGAHWVSYRLGGAIPPHSYRWILCCGDRPTATWRPQEAARATATFGRAFRVGWITKTEDINLVTMVAIGATKATMRADAASCRHHPPGSP
jgi:hypothetical protein